jgi:hypothetical protein
MLSKSIIDSTLEHFGYDEDILASTCGALTLHFKTSLSGLDSDMVLLVDGLHFDLIERLGNQLDLNIASLPDKDRIEHVEETLNGWLCKGFGIDESLVYQPLLPLDGPQLSPGNIPNSVLQDFNAPYAGGGIKIEAWRRALCCISNALGGFIGHNLH